MCVQCVLLCVFFKYQYKSEIYRQDQFAVNVGQSAVKMLARRGVPSPLFLPPPRPPVKRPYPILPSLPSYSAVLSERRRWQAWAHSHSLPHYPIQARRRRHGPTSYHAGHATRPVITSPSPPVQSTLAPQPAPAATAGIADTAGHAVTDDLAFTAGLAVTASLAVTAGLAATTSPLLRKSTKPVGEATRSGGWAAVPAKKKHTPQLDCCCFPPPPQPHRHRRFRAWLHRRHLHFQSRLTDQRRPHSANINIYTSNYIIQANVVAKPATDPHLSICNSCIVHSSIFNRFAPLVPKISY